MRPAHMRAAKPLPGPKWTSRCRLLKNWDLLARALDEQLCCREHNPSHPNLESVIDPVLSARLTECPPRFDSD